MRIKQLHILKTISIFILTFAFINCSNQEVASHNLKVGMYASEKQNIIEMLYDKYILNTTQVIGDTLKIYDNTNFSFVTCGNYGYGKYEIKGDSLYLNYDSSATRRDSIMYYEKYTDVYYIEDNTTLIMEMKLKNTLESKETFDGLSKLHYIENKQPKQ